MSRELLWFLTKDERFPKTISQWEFDYGLFTKLLIIIVAREFSRTSFNSKKASYLNWKNKYPNLKSTCQIKPKFFLWIKLLQNQLIAKYLIYVPAATSTFVTQYSNILLRRLFTPSYCSSICILKVKFQLL